MASYDTGYDDERFLHPVGQTLHCGICTNVLKDPVMCCQNEHLFCRACITMHLLKSQTCPNCMEPLTVATLSQASRGIRNLLAELKIKCKFFDRGCGKFIELEHLEKHVADCGFAPAVCSNEGCRLQVNKRDLLHHETSVCDLRRVQCHSCVEIRQEMDTLSEDVAEVTGKLDRSLNRIDEIEVNVIAKFEEALSKQEETNHQLNADIDEIKKSLNEVQKQLGRMTETLHEVRTEKSEKSVADADKKGTQPRVVVVGGSSVASSVEMFSPSCGTWGQLQPLGMGRQGASSVIYNDQVLVMGGYLSGGGTKSIKKLSLTALNFLLNVAQHIPWKDFPADLHTSLHGHCCVVYNGRLIVIGGYDGEKKAPGDSISEVSLVSPYTCKLLATMPQTRWYHGVELFDDKIVIFGGAQGEGYGTNLETVVMYDITKSEFLDLAPLPYAVSQAAAVKWGDHRVIIAGGVDKKGKALNKVLMYNIKTQKSHELPEMECKRKACAAAFVGDTVIVMGGEDENGNVLKSVEGFRFHRYSWQKLPEMHEKRYAATAVVC